MPSRLFAVFTLLVPLVGGALPVLRLGLTGDARTLGLGGVLPYESPSAAAWRLERPALLADELHPRLRVAAEREATIDLSGKQPWAGTRGSDFRSRATLAVPFTWRDVPFTVAVSGRIEDGALRLSHQRDGVLFDVAEQRTAVQLAVAARPWRWLRLGTTAATGSVQAWGVEGVVTLGPLELGLVRRAEELAYEVSAPPGPQQRFQRPAMVDDVTQLRQIAAFTLALRTPWLDAEGQADLLHPGDFLAQAAARVGPVTLRGRSEATGFAFDNWARHDGTDLARVNLGIRQSRWAVAAEWRVGRHLFTAGHQDTALWTESAWADNGEVTGRALLSLDADFELYLRHWYRARFVHDGIGWRWTGEAFTFTAGLQHARITSEAGGIEYGSQVVEQIHGRDEVPEVVLKAVGVTGGVSWRAGPLTLRFALAQLVPYAMQQAATKVRDGGTTSGGGTTRTTTGSATGRSSSSSSDGGRLYVLEAEHAF